MKCIANLMGIRDVIQFGCFGKIRATDWKELRASIDIFY